MDGRERAALRQRGRRRVSCRGRCARRPEVQPPARLHRRPGRGQRIPGSGRAESAALPPPRRTHTLPQFQGHHRRSDPGRRWRRPHPDLPFVAAAAPLPALPGRPLRRHERHLAGRAILRRFHRHPRAAQRGGRRAEGTGWLSAPAHLGRARHLRAAARRRLGRFRRLRQYRRPGRRHRAPALRRPVRQPGLRARRQRGGEDCTGRRGRRRPPQAPVERHHERPVGDLRQHRHRRAVCQFPGAPIR